MSLGIKFNCVPVSNLISKLNNKIIIMGLESVSVSEDVIGDLQIVQANKNLLGQVACHLDCHHVIVKYYFCYVYYKYVNFCI